MTKNAFLTAQWRYLVMLNYEIAPSALKPLVPAGTELDDWNGRHFVSMVGFMFLDTRVLGIPVPFHRNFEEVNLRFYVRHRAAEGWRRGVVFVRELVPRRAIAWTARTIYNEPYMTVPMGHCIELEGGDPRAPRSIAYSWRFKGRENSLAVKVAGAPAPIAAGTEEEFITEHYWGYTRQRDGSTIEYQVEHPQWSIWRTEESSLQCNVSGLYGESFEVLAGTPVSAFLADGSLVAVHRGVRLRR